MRFIRCIIIVISDQTQISWFTHSSLQFFEQDQWKAFMAVHKNTRAKVALALKFKIVVVAILFLDLIIQVLPSPHLFSMHLTLFIHSLVPLGKPRDI